MPCSLGIGGCRFASAGVFHREADLDAHLIVLDLAVLDVAARLQDLEPAQMPDSAVGTRNCRADGVFNAFVRRANQLKDFVDMLLHDGFSLATAQMFSARP